MNFLRVLGFLRDAAGIDVGREVIDKIRSSVRAETPEENEQMALDIEALLAEHHARVGREIDAVRQQVQRQNEQFAMAIRRQRIWNFVLSAGIIVALIVAVFAAA